MAIQIPDEWLKADTETIDKFNCIVMGDISTGKTTSLLTARRPVLISMFDPGGHVTIKDHIGIDNGIIVDRFDREDLYKPTQYNRWQTKFNDYSRRGIFNHLGTYVIDSITLWSDAMMNERLRTEGRVGTPPQLHDYNVTINLIKGLMTKMASLPCDFIVTGHLESEKDEVTGAIKYGLMIAGKTRVKVPLLMDEVYVSLSRAPAKPLDSPLYDRSHSFLTRSVGPYTARTRLGAGNKFETYEVPDFKRLLKIAGLPHEDKPKLRSI